MGRGRRINPLVEVVSPGSGSLCGLLRDIAQGDRDDLAGAVELFSRRAHPRVAAMRPRAAEALLERLAREAGDARLLQRLSQRRRRELAELVWEEASGRARGPSLRYALPALLVRKSDDEESPEAEWARAQLRRQLAFGSGAPQDPELLREIAAGDDDDPEARRLRELVFSWALEAQEGAPDASWLRRVARSFESSPEAIDPDHARVVASACRRCLELQGDRTAPQAGRPPKLEEAICFLYRKSACARAMCRLMERCGTTRQAALWLLRHHPELNAEQAGRLVARAYFDLVSITNAIIEGDADPPRCAQVLYERLREKHPDVDFDAILGGLG